jgi:hypothetical protein
LTLILPARGDEPGGRSLTVAAQTSLADFKPDPLSVERYGPAYRYPQAGWVVLHIEGDPYERGYQHGRLMAPELAACVRCWAALASPGTPAEGWKNIRTLVNALFLRRYQKEYLEEMKGIADGATAAGARYDNRPIDLVDIVALNAQPELETLDSALEATPTGLEGIRFRHQEPRAMPAPKPMHCSAFAATGPATADGKIVFGHITMFGLYPSLFYNVWLDVKPTQGHRVLMQTYPGGIQSGLDYYMNDAGLLVCETTIRQTRFDITGEALASRIRRALQYADGIDSAAAILSESNNGLYTNEWLLGDIKTNEIAMLELGTAKTKLYRSSKNEWFGGAPGFYWGCNNTKDLDVRLETIPGVNAAPANMVWRPTDRDRMWLDLYNRHKGKIDASFGKLAFTTPPVAAHSSLDAKFTTSDMAKDLKTWALFGPPLGQTWQPTPEERKRFPEVRPMVGNPWTVLHAGAPAKVELAGARPLDLADRMDAEARDRDLERRDERRQQVRSPAWCGTILPQSDTDIWLATAFADYERVLSTRREGRPSRNRTEGRPVSDERSRLGLALFGSRSTYLAGARAGGDVPLARTHPEFSQDDWYRVAAGKGLLVLHELHRTLGDEHFRQMMEEFGRQHDGKQVTSAEFVAAASKSAGKPLEQFFDYWLNKSSLPTLYLEAVDIKPAAKGYVITGSIAGQPLVPGMRVDVTVEADKSEETKTITVDLPSVEASSTGFSTRPAALFTIECAQRPKRLVVDKYGLTAKTNGGAFSLLSFYHDLPQTLIVYGTADEVASNREAAEALQRAIVESGPNYTVPIKSDKDVVDRDLSSHHLLLIGRPDTNRCVERFRSAFPVEFGWRSFRVNNESYAHPGSAVIAAGENPLNGRYSVVVLAGLGADSTWQTPSKLVQRGPFGNGEVMVLPHGSRPRTVLVPAPELVRDFGRTQDKNGGNGGDKAVRRRQ